MNTLNEIINLLLLQGNFGSPAPVPDRCMTTPNVQGERTMDVWGKPQEWILKARDKKFSIGAPRVHGLDSVDTVAAFENENVDVFISMGGNFALTCSDTVALDVAMQRVGLTVHVSTKPNGSHATAGTTSLILPTLGRTDTNDKHPKVRQVLPVENLTVPEAHPILQTVRSHEHYNTRFYGLDDRYRGI